MHGLVSRGSARLPSILFGAVLVVSAWAPVGPVLAQSFMSEQMDELRNAFGVGRERAPIDFTERAPLVVPPSYNLPPPGQGDPALGVKDPDEIARRRALTDSRRPVPPTDPGSNASGYAKRAYLVDPPSGMRDPAAAAGTTDQSEAPRATHKRHARKKPTASASTQ